MEKVIENQKRQINSIKNDDWKEKEIHRWRKKNYYEIRSLKKKLVWKK